MTAAPPTSELAAFLTRMLDADEAAAREATPGPWIVPDNSNGGVWVHQDGNDWDDVVSDTDGTPADAAHIARHDPARVLAQVAALRAVVAAHPYSDEGDHCCADPETPYGEKMFYGGDPCPTLRHVAAIWASNPAFDPAWSA